MLTFNGPRLDLVTWQLVRASYYGFMFNILTCCIDFLYNSERFLIFYTNKPSVCKLTWVRFWIEIVAHSQSRHQNNKTIRWTKNFFIVLRRARIRWQIPFLIHCKRWLKRWHNFYSPKHSVTYYLLYYNFYFV